jgi:hypothetical protein
MGLGATLHQASAETTSKSQSRAPDPARTRYFEWFSSFFFSD